MEWQKEKKMCLINVQINFFVLIPFFFLLYLFMNDWVQMNSPVIKMGQIALKVKFVKK